MQHYTMPKVSHSIIMESEDGWHTQEKQYHTEKMLLIMKGSIHFPNSKGNKRMTTD